MYNLPSLFEWADPITRTGAPNRLEGGVCTTCAPGDQEKSIEGKCCHSFEGCECPQSKARYFAASASISTLNSGRVKPLTIISVEAGAGSVT